MELRINFGKLLSLVMTYHILCLSASWTQAYEAPADCEWAFFTEQDSETRIALTCHLSAINSDSEKTNFSVIPSDFTAGLTVKCSDLIQEGSRLEPGLFSSLRSLEELTLDGCRIEHIPDSTFVGLNKLRLLSLKDQGSSFLEIESGAFAGLTQLQDLDLSGNYLSSLPKRELCNVPELRSLNVSANEMATVLDIGSDCLLEHLEVLDVSSNEITALEGNIDFMPGLKELYLGSNFIRQCDVLVLESAAALEVLDLSDNQILELPTGIFEKLQKLIVLSLANNSLTTLEAHLLDGLSSLEILDLSGNNLSELSSRLFADLANLVELVLSQNRLSGSLQANLFTPLSELQALKLDNNQLENFSALSAEEGSSSSNNNKLRELDLSNNRLATLGSTGASSQLTHLHLSHNNLNTLSSDALKNCTNILVLDLSHNKLTQVPSSLRHLKALQTLDLSSNSIDSLANAPILSMDHLWRLQLSHNKLKNVTSDLLNRLESLQILDLSSNQVQHVEGGSFDANQKLQAIRLDGNQLKAMDSLFQNLEQLIWLNISDNQLVEFDYAMIPANLHWLDLSHNELTVLGNYFDLTGELELSVLDASFNSLKQLGPNSIPDSIETLNVNDNRIQQIVPYTFFKKTKLSKVDLTVNSLKNIDRNALRLSSDVKALPEFYLGGNPIECDCDMVWFKTINTQSSLQNYPMVQDIESIYCRLVYTREVSFVPLVEARNEQFLCPYETHCFALCKCCDFDACDCEMSCPDNCTCYHDNSWSKNIAVCSASNFNDLPEQLPMDATEIFLDGNNLSELGSHTFIGRKNLRALHLNNSQIGSIQNKTFNGLKSLTVLHLENNQLSSLDGYEFETLSNLRELYLQNNLLSSIHNATFKFLRSLEVLHLHGNHIIDFPVWQLAFNPFLVSVKLAENLWSCDCEYMERFRSWMSVYSAKIFDSESISCVTNDAGEMNVRMSDFDVSTCTSNSMQSIATTRVQEMMSEDYLPLLAATLASFAVVLLVMLFVFMYRQTIRVMIHSKYGVRMFDSSYNEAEEAADVESGKKHFDVFISYSPKDDAFVRDTLATELEHNTSSHNYKACLYHRDIANQTYVADTLMQATEASRRSVVVLSDNFLKSEWSRYDYKSGLHQALRTGRKKLIVILIGELQNRDVDPDLRLYLKTAVVLRYGEKLFWENLRYALPDKPLKRSFSGQLPPEIKTVSAVADQHLQFRPSPTTSSSSSTSTNISMVEDHYYQQPRYATYLPPPPPQHQQQLQQLQHHQQQQQQLQNNIVFLNNNLQVSSASPPLPQQHQQQHHHYHQPQYSGVSSVGSSVGQPSSNNLPQQQQQQQQQSQPLPNMPSLPGQQVPARAVVMHI